MTLLSRKIYGSDKKDKDLYYFAAGPKGLSCVKWKEKCLVVLLNDKEKKEQEFYFDEIKPGLYKTTIYWPESDIS